MNEESRPPRRNRSRRRPDGGARRPVARANYPRRRNDYATGGYSSIYAGPFPTDEDQLEPLSLQELQAKPVDELRELAAEHGVEGGEELEHQDLVLKLLDAVPLAPARHRQEQNGQPGVADGVLEIVDEG